MNELRFLEGVVLVIGVSGAELLCQNARVVVAVVGLAPVWERYHTLDPATVALERQPSPEE